jgi:hypothetical protein
VIAMTIITATCPQHGRVRCAPKDVRLCLRDNLQILLSFPCPDCHGIVHHPAPWKVVPLLAEAGIHLTIERGAARGPAFTVDDLIDFHCWLKRHDNLVAYLSADVTEPPG